MFVQNFSFVKYAKNSYSIRFKNGVTVDIVSPTEKDKLSILDQIEKLFNSSATYLKVYGLYHHNGIIEDITEVLTGMKGDYAVASAEELADVLYKAKNYTPFT